MKDLHIKESHSLEFRAEFLNAFNHAQFYGISSVDGNFNDGPGAFRHVTSAASGRIGQLAIKYLF
jgi:hypothetical protein